MGSEMRSGYGGISCQSSKRLLSGGRIRKEGVTNGVSAASSWIARKKNSDKAAAPATRRTILLLNCLIVCAGMADDNGKRQMLENVDAAEKGGKGEMRILKEGWKCSWLCYPGLVHRRWRVILHGFDLEPNCRVAPTPTIGAIVST